MILISLIILTADQLYLSGCKNGRLKSRNTAPLCLFACSSFKYFK